MIRVCVIASAIKPSRPYGFRNFDNHPQESSPLCFSVISRLSFQPSALRFPALACSSRDPESKHEEITTLGKGNMFTQACHLTYRNGQDLDSQPRQANQNRHREPRKLVAVWVYLELTDYFTSLSREDENVSEIRLTEISVSRGSANGISGDTRRSGPRDAQWDQVVKTANFKLQRHT